jgi:predicted PurR-regulated permease PerM
VQSSGQAPREDRTPHLSQRPAGISFHLWMWNMPISAAKSVYAGWSVLIGLLALFVLLGLLKFLVFLLFMQLVVDLLVHNLGGRIPFVSRKVALYAVYILVAAIIVILVTVLVPRFVADLPDYVKNLDQNMTGRVGEWLASWKVPVQVSEFKPKAIDWIREHIGESLDYAKRAGTNIVLWLIAFVLTFLINHGRLGRSDSGKTAIVAPHLWGFLAAFIEQKIGAFYGFFRQVMAGQVVISAINTVLTLGLLIVLGIPNKIALVVLVFLFGLMPVIGNLISNTLICISALLWAGLFQVAMALAFLVIIHKLEYFLNSKIIGNIVKLPVYMTLLGLIVGESLFQVSGIILAIPVILFVRAELSAVTIHANAAPQSHG